MVFRGLCASTIEMAYLQLGKHSVGDWAVLTLWVPKHPCNVRQGTRQLWYGREFIVIHDFYVWSIGVVIASLTMCRNLPCSEFIHCCVFLPPHLVTRMNNNHRHLPENCLVSQCWYMLKVRVPGLILVVVCQQTQQRHRLEGQIHWLNFGKELADRYCKGFISGQSQLC